MTVHVLGGMGAVHTHTEKGTRTCARDGCDSEFVPREAKHRFCSQACRNAQWKVDREYQDRRAVNPSRNGSGRVRKPRPARIRPTLTLDEARALARATYRGDDPAATATQKIRDALARQERADG